VIAIAAALALLGACDSFGWNPALAAGSKRTPAEAKGLREVQELMARGDLARAVDAARALGDTAGAQQALGIALAAADRPDEASAIATKLDETAGDNVRSAIAATRCAYGEAADLQMKILAKSGEKTTVVNLAELDIAGGNHARAIERLEHALRLPSPEGTPPEVAAAIDRQTTRSLALAYLRAGRTDEGRARLRDVEPGELEDAALRVSEYALREKRALRRAALALSGAILAARARADAGADSDDTKLREAHAAILRMYGETRSSCHDVLPDLEAVDGLGAR
jgi:hypothetical protein